MAEEKATPAMPASAYEMESAMQVFANEDLMELTMVFRPKEESGDPAIAVMLPAGAVGHFVSQLAAAHQSLAMKAGDRAGVFLPLQLTGARPSSAPDGSDVLLLQFDNVFELAVLIPKNRIANLARALERLREPGPRRPPARH